MTKELAEAIQACFKADNVPCQIMLYSGRAMFGRETTAIVGEFSITDVLSTVIAHAELLCDGGESMFVGEDLSIDHMGKDYVVY